MTKDISALPVRIYSAQWQRTFLLASQCRAVQEVWQTRWVLWSLFVRDFLGQYRQKLLGYFWAILTPLITVASFLFLYLAGILHPGELDIPYPLYVFVGTGLWGIFVGVYQAVSTGLTTHGDLLVRTGVPRIALALSGLANVVYSLLLHLITLGILLAWCRFLPAWQAALYPFLLAPLFALGIGLGLTLGVLSAIARDINSMFSALLNFLMYLTPVVYVASFSQPVLKALVAWNPMSYLIDCPRRLLLLGRYTDWPGYGLAAGFAFAVLVMGIHAFYVIQDRISERL